MRIRLSIPDHLVTPRALEAALEATSLANAEAIRRGELPHVEDVLASGAKWKPEPFLDGEHFDLGHEIVQRGWGDCDDWAPLLTGSLIASGDDPGARTRIVKTGKNRWHAVVETSDGQVLDPSRWAGMGRRSAPNAVGVSGSAVAKPFAHPDGGALCVVPHAGQWWARCDVPWPDGSGHLASHARSRDIDAALLRAVSGAVDCGEQIDSPIVERAQHCARFLLGPDVDAGEVGSTGDFALGAYAHLPKWMKSGLGKGLLGDKLKQWEDESRAKGYSEQNQPDPNGPDGWKAWALAHGFHKGKSTTFGAALRGAGRVIRGVSNTAAPIAANVMAPGTGTLLSQLASGSGAAGALLQQLAPGHVITAPGGAVSVPLEHPESDSPQHMFLYYHPRGNPGPVIMRF